jgi:hypothetical protein
MGIHFRGPTCNVEGWDVGGVEQPQTRFRYFPIHGFASVRPGIYMAMAAGLIADLTHIDL